MRKHFTILIFITIISGLGFTSCEKNNHWINGFLDCFFYPTSDIRGNFFSREIYSVRDISGVVSSRADIRSIQFVGSTFIIEGDLKAGDIISDLTIDIDGVGSFRFPPFAIRRNGEIITFDTRNNREFSNFMATAIQLLNNTNRLDIIVSGIITDSRGFPINNVNIDLALKTDLDINVSNF